VRGASRQSGRGIPRARFREAAVDLLTRPVLNERPPA
jgi:hypothetical protein